MTLRKKIWLSLLLAVFTVVSGALVLRSVREPVRNLLTGRPTTELVRGQISYLDRAGDLLFLQNERAIYRVDAPDVPEELRKGDEVEITASLETDAGERDLHATRVSILEKRPGLRPIQLEGGQLSEHRFNKKLVEISGVVRAASFEVSGQLALRLKVGKQDVKVRLCSPLGLQSDAVVDSKVRVVGVLESETDPGGQFVRAVILAQESSDVQVEEWPKPLRDFEVKTVRELEARPPDELVHRVRMRGTIHRTSSGELKLTDETGSIALQSVAEQAKPNTQYDAWGFISDANRTLALENAVWVESEESGSGDPVGEGSLAELTTVAQVHGLSSTAARRGYPVTLHGVITYVHNRLHAIFLQDATGGIYVPLGPEAQKELAIGQRAELKGITGPGEFAPVVNSAKLTIEGVGPLPKPSAVDLNEIFSGRQDSNWVELQGIVHGIRTDRREPYAIAQLAGNTFRIYTPELEDLPGSLIDAKVSVKGVCGTLFNSRGQILGIRLYVPGRAFIKVLSSQTAADQLPIQPVVSLERFSAQEEPGHRHRIQGVVTRVGRGGLIYLRDNTGALRGESNQATGLRPGDLVDMVGFVKHDDAGPILTEASMKILKRGVPVVPQQVSAREVLEEGYEAQLIQLNAILMDRAVAQGDETLVLRSGHTLFQARLEKNQSPLLAAKGSLLQLQGICELQRQLGHTARNADFTLLLRSRSDVVVLKTAPWWNSEAFGWWLIGIGGLTSLVVVWALLLRRQVKSQTQLIRRQLNEAEHLREGAEAASRAKGEFLANMSHEIRTPLNGVLGMTELALMEPLPEAVREYLETAHASGMGLLQVINDVLDVSKIEAGKMTVEIAPFNLADVLKQALLLFRPTAKQKAIRLHLEFPPHMPQRFQGDSVRIRQIVLTLVGNALKFTERGEVRIRVLCRVVDEQLRMLRIEVHDTGIGIPLEKQSQLFRSFHQADTSTTRRYGGTGLGLSISKQLVELMGGSIRCASAPGEGSVFSFELPLRLADGKAVDQEGSRQAVSSPAKNLRAS